MSAAALAARRAILWGGLIAGTCDLVFALCYYGFKLAVFQTVTGGLIGRTAALRGGWLTFGVGIALHFAIAFIWAALFWAISRQADILSRHAILSGLAWGLVIYVGMNSVVLPLSALHTPPWPLPLALFPILVHLLGVGLPIALAAQKAARRAKL